MPAGLEETEGVQATVEAHCAGHAGMPTDSHWRAERDRLALAGGTGQHDGVRLMARNMTAMQRSPAAELAVHPSSRGAWDAGQ